MAAVSILVPIFVCVVLPVSIVLIIYLASINSDNKRAQILIKAIESGNNIDSDRLAEALRKPVKTPRELLNLRLLRGCIFGIMGLFLLVAGIIGFYAGGEYADGVLSEVVILGCIFLPIGISYLIVYFVTRKNVDNK